MKVYGNHESYNNQATYACKVSLWSVLPLSNIDIEADFLGSTVPGSSQPSKYKLGK